MGRFDDRSSAQPAPPKKGWPLSSLLLFAVSGVLALLALLLWTGTIRLPYRTPPVTPGAIKVVDVVSALRAQGLSAEEDQKLFVPIREFPVPGQGLIVEGNPLLLFIFPDPAAAQSAVAAANPGNVLPATLPGGRAVSPDSVVITQGSNVAAALVGGDERVSGIVKSVIEGLP
ncbi:MAG: hypothetical protein ACR2J8_04625 [Thermomicrobiales bacterium]